MHTGNAIAVEGRRTMHHGWNIEHKPTCRHAHTHTHIDRSEREFGNARVCGVCVGR